MSGFVPLLALAYFGVQYYSVQKVYSATKAGMSKLPVGPSGEALMRKGPMSRYRAPPGGATVFKPLEHPDWQRVRPGLERPKLYSKQDAAKHAAVTAQIDLDPVRVARNIPAQAHLLDWNGNARFPSFVVDRYATSHATSRHPEVQQMYKDGKAAHTRADTRVGGYA